MTKFNLKKAEKTKNQIEVKNSTYFIVILGAILIFIAPLIHINLPEKNATVELFKEKNKEVFVNFKKERIKIRKDYDNKLISGDQKIAQDDLLERKEKEFLNSYQKELSIVKDNNRIFGWLTLRQFLVGFGVRLPYLFFTLLIVYLIQKINTEDKHLKRAFTFMQIALFTISFYLLIWVFWDMQDFPKGYYYATSLFLGFLASIASVSFLKYRKELEVKLKSAINRLIVFIIKSETHLEKESTRKQYYREYMAEFKQIVKES